MSGYRGHTSWRCKFSPPGTATTRPPRLLSLIEAALTRYRAEVRRFSRSYGQLANIFGRRKLLIASIAFFILGSGICGGANSVGMLIAGRTVQGLGGAGINLLVELIICDLVPLRERGQYTSIIYSASIVGSAMGPWIGGELVEKASWRWVFYINLPIGGAALVIVALVLNVKQRRLTLRESLRRIDYVGNLLFLGAAIAVMYALIYGGVKHPWGAWQIIVPLVLGVVGFLGFALFEASPYCVEPALPARYLEIGRPSLPSSSRSSIPPFSSGLHTSSPCTSRPYRARAPRRPG